MSKIENIFPTFITTTAHPQLCTACETHSNLPNTCDQPAVIALISRKTKQHTASACAQHLQLALNQAECFTPNRLGEPNNDTHI